MTNGHKPWTLSAERLLTELSSSERGLSGAEAKKRLTEHGPNEIAGKGRREGLEIFISQFTNALVLILIAAAILAYFLGETIDAIVILAIVFINAVLGFFQEYRAEKALSELKQYVTLSCRVMRDGVLIETDAKNLVVGDIVHLDIGDIVPADIRLLHADELTADESTLTGESVPTEKNILEIDAKYSSPADLSNMALMGTAVASGIAYGVVVATGRSTFFGKTAAYLKQTVHEGDFQRNIRNFSNMLLKVIILMTVFVFAANALLGKPFFDSFLFAIALAVGITPEILPIIVTISLSNGALRMAKEKVITKRLVSVEDLGNIDTLCCDKTGTLTEGELSLAGHFDLEGRQEEKLMIYGLLCNSATTSKGKKTFGNAVDRAIWESEKTIGHKMHLEKYKVTDINEFDFKRRRMSVAVRKPDGSDVLISKGAPAEILEVSSSATVGGQQTPMSADLMARIRTTVELYERDGYKIITIAEKPVTDEETSKSDESGLCIVGFLLFIDPPKKTAKASLEKLQNLGVAIKVISGDSVLVTRKICHDVGMCTNVPNVGAHHHAQSCPQVECTRIVSGEELDTLSEKEFTEYVRNYGIFARVTPEQKYRIVMSLKREGHIVGFLGDGINDVPALKAADVGITVDSATGIAKEEADIILLKKSLRVLAHGIVEGRKTFGNITKYILNTISANTGNMITVALSSLFLPFIPLLPSQILLNNFMSDLPMLTISTDKVDEELLKKPRRWNLPMIWEFMFYFGAISSLFDLLFIVPLILFGVGEGVFRTAWFLESVLSEIVITFAVRTSRPFYKSMPSNWLLVASLTVGIGSAAIIFTDFGKKYFQFEALTPAMLAFMGAILLAYFLTAEAAKKRFFKKHGM